MKMGVREFRERISEVINGNEPVVVTRNGTVVGRYVPEGPPTPVSDIDWADWRARRAAFRRDWITRTPDWRERLIAAGLDGEDLDDPETEELDPEGRDGGSA